MRNPRHYVGSYYSGSTALPFTMIGTSDRSVYITDSQRSKDFLWDTDRGRDKVNDCVHIKPLGAETLKQASMLDFSVNGIRYRPQGTWGWVFNSRAKTWNYYVWAHQYEYIPDFDAWRPVLYQAHAYVYMGRKSKKIGPVSINGYYGYGPELRVQKMFSVPVPDGAKEGSRYSVYYSYIFCQNKAKPGDGRTPLTIWVKAGSILPTGYWMPGTGFDPDNWYYDEDSLKGELLSDLRGQAEAGFMYLKSTPLSELQMRTGIVRGVHDTIAPDDVYGTFLFNEDEVLISKIPLAVRNPNFYWRNWLIQHAYLEACQSVPAMSDNSISNVIEIAGFMKSLLIDHEIEFPKRLQDAWLAYRYTYTTTKLDVQEAIKFAKRHMDLGSLDVELKCYGVATHEVSGETVTCRCALSIAPRELGILGKAWRALTTYGLAPDFYVIWDMIPYSFIVDWFVPVGDMLSVLDAGKLYGGEYYSIRDVSFSMSYTRHLDYTYKVYTRWASDPLTTFNEFYWLDKPASSSKVKLFRILDTASLFIGGN